MLSNARPAVPFDATAEPALKPNQPNHSKAAPSITKSNTICNTHSPFQLLVTPIGGLFGSNSGVSLSGLFTPAYASIGNNVVNYSITSGPCIAYAQTTITVEKFVSASFDKYPKSVYCKGSEFPFNLNSLVQNPGYNWSGLGVVGNMFNPNIANIGNNHVIYWTNSITNVCKDSSMINIFVAKTPTVVVSTNVSSGCIPLQVIFSTDKNKLFIPNPNTPKFSLLQASENTAQTDFTSVLKCSVEHGGNVVRFPYDQPIVKGSVAGRTPGKIQHGDDGTFLYSESFSTTKYSKKFLLNIAEESDLENINITIIYKAKRITSYYVIPIINHSML